MSGRLPSRGSDQFVVRMPDGMRDALKQAADEAGRSTNAEIVHRLQVTLDADKGLLSGPALTNPDIRRVADLAAAKAAVEAIDAVLEALSLPDGTPDAARFQHMVRKSMAPRGSRTKEPKGSN